MLEQQPKFGSVSYQAGHVIIRQGDIPDKFYIITNGQVEVIRHDEAGNEEVIDHLGLGEYFGEVGLVKWIRRIATIRAVTDVELIAMDYQAFAGWVGRSDMLQQEIDEIVNQRLQVEDNPQPVEREPAPTTTAEAGTEAGKTAVPLQKTITGDPGGARFYAVGTEIIRQGDPADTFYIILEGLVEVVKTLPDGREIHIARLAAGSYFGEIGIMENQQRMASVRALSDVRLVAFDRETFNGWLADSPSSKIELQETSTQRQLDTGQLRRLVPPLSESE
jgi:cAMP-dependent protein kinase regulator